MAPLWALVDVEMPGGPRVSGEAQVVLAGFL